MILFRQLFDRQSCTYSYLLADARTKEAILIDSVLDLVERDHKLLKELDLTLKYALETHVHADHPSGAVALRELTQCKIGLSEKSGARGMDIALAQGTLLKFGSQTLSVIETPGHTEGCVSYLIEKRLFTGDALFIRGCGRTDFQQGDASVLYDSIKKKIFSLPKDTLIYPGHDYQGQTVSTVFEESKFNPRLTQSKEAFIKLMKTLKLPPPARMEEVLPHNLNLTPISKKNAPKIA